MSPLTGTFWALLAGTAAAAWILPARFRATLVALVSLAYLATAQWQSAVALTALIALFHGLAPHCAPDRPEGRRFAVAGVLLAATFLVVFKYLPPLARALWPEGPVASLVLPLGASYFTFKLIHFVVETRRGALKHRSLPDFACWLLLFPAFVAGPIERFDHFLANRADRLGAADLSAGLTRIGHGLVKKFVVAEMLLREGRMEGVSTADLVASLADQSGKDVRIHILGTLLYMYFDFAGYSDMAIGGARLLGFGIQENFDRPLLASDLPTFWKRWHMTLAGWCQSYVYMPILGRTRNPYWSVYGSFFVMGMWHAANWNYLAWALWQATGVAVVLTWNRMQRQRGWKLPNGRWREGLGILLTWLFMCVATVFSATYDLGIGAAVRLGAKAIEIDL